MRTTTAPLRKKRQYPEYTDYELTKYANFINRVGVSKVNAVTGLNKPTLYKMANREQLVYKISTKARLDAAIKSIRQEAADAAAAELLRVGNGRLPLPPKAAPLNSPFRTVALPQAMVDVGIEVVDDLNINDQVVRPITDIDAMRAIRDVMEQLSAEDKVLVLNYISIKYIGEVQ